MARSPKRPTTNVKVTSSDGARTLVPSRPTPEPSRPAPVSSRPALAPVSSRPALAPVSSRPTLAPAPSRPTLAPAPSRDGVRARASSMLSTSHMKKSDSETEGDDSDWSYEKDGVDDDVSEKLHAFIQAQKSNDKPNSAMYTYMKNVMDDEDEYDGNHPHIRKLTEMLPTFNSNFQRFSREEYEEDAKAFSMKDIQKYLEAGIDDDDYEDDGWIVKDI